MPTLNLTIDSIKPLSYAPAGGGSASVRASGTLTLQSSPRQGGNETITNVDPDPPVLTVRMAGSSPVAASVARTTKFVWTWTAVVAGTAAPDGTSVAIAGVIVSGTLEFDPIGPEPAQPDDFTVNASATVPISDLIDKDPPAIEVQSIVPDRIECGPPGSSTRVAVRGSATDAKGGVREVLVGVESFGTTTSAAPDPVYGWFAWSANVDVPAEVGTYRIIAKAYDNCGNPQENSAPVTVVDTTSPNFLNIRPPTEVLFDDVPVPFTISGAVRDAGTGVENVLVRLAGIETTVNVDQSRNIDASWSVSLTAPTADVQRVEVLARDRAGNATPVSSVHVTVTQVPLPRVAIASPRDGDEIPGTQQGALVEVSGTAGADRSAVKDVRVVLDNGPFDDTTLATLNYDQGECRWTKEVFVPASGSHTITARVQNKARNPNKNWATDSVHVTVGVPVMPVDNKDTTSLLAYLNDLLEFAGRRIRISSPPPARAAETADFKREFHQPFGDFRDNEAQQAVRIGVEVLRDYLASIPGRPARPEESYQPYRQAAYLALLTQFGSSYDELCRLRRAVPADASTISDWRMLGDRMGIDLDLDRIKALLLAPTTLTETDLESVFGLRDTARSPLDRTAPQPKLFQWKLDRLYRLWMAQERAVDGGAPIIDPDLLSDGDFKSASGLAYERWTTRQGWVAQALKRLADDRAPGEADSVRLRRLIDKVLGANAAKALQELDANRKEGRDVAGEMAKYELDVPAFNLLLRLMRVPAADTLLADEWGDAYSVLVQTQKRKQFAAWRQEEAADSLVLGPTYFKIAEHEPLLPRWRASTEARRRWQATLQSRNDQQEAMRQGYWAALRGVEAAVLPLLRNALVRHVSQSDKVDVADWLTQRLMIDVKAAGDIQTTRLTQAAETVQAIMGALRSERFMDMQSDGSITAPVTEGWTLTVPNALPSEVGQIFDQEWGWMSSYGQWRAAARVFVYPENLLLPAIRPQNLSPSRPGYSMTPEFRELLDQLGKLLHVSPDAVHWAVGNPTAQGYRGYVLSLNPEVVSELVGLNANWEEQTFLLNETIGEADLERRRKAVHELTKLTDTHADQARLKHYVAELFYFVPVHFALQLHQAGHYTAALDWFRTVYAYNLPQGRRKIASVLTKEQAYATSYTRTDEWLRTKLNPHDVAPSRANAYTRFTIISIVRCLLDFADAEFASDSGESIARARTLYLGALELLDGTDMRLNTLRPPPHEWAEPAELHGFAPNPEPKGLRLHIVQSLAKIRAGYNVAGFARRLASVASSLDDAPVTGLLRPTPYRYSLLIERTKQLVTLAQQVEDRYLTSLEKQDAETYNLLKAHGDLQVTQATVQVHKLRVVEADAGVLLAKQQIERSQYQAEHYSSLLQVGLSVAERANLDGLAVASKLQLDAAASSALAATLPASYSIGGGVSVGFPSGGTASLSYSKSWSPSGEESSKASALSSTAGATSTLAAISSTQASYERRKEEWSLQQGVAKWDGEIGQQQYNQSLVRADIAAQEKTVAQTQADHAEAALMFLASKFTNAELYEWMSGILGRVYAFFLQQAAATARLAEYQLAFERQEQPLAVIRPDYWQATGKGSGVARDRKGLTGSARLLEDIYRLDQYAFETDRRKLQLSKTISLRSLTPLEFQQFMQSGTLVFATPMALFDRDFPGHYLRLVRRVRLSVVALIPPTQGIHATLGTSGLSRVVIPDGGFRAVVIRRDPELVALTSPLNGSGVFELDTQPELLLPFEGMGVDSAWFLELPKPANPFDFRTIADVLMTVEYTALHSYGYRQQVIQAMDRRLGADHPVSVRGQFPDQWYEFNNAPSSSPSRLFRFNLSRDNFPPNVEDVTIGQVALYLLGTDGKAVAATDVELHLTYRPKEGETRSVGGLGQVVDGVVSTRRSNAGDWLSLVGAPPVGEWTCTLQGSSELDAQIANGELEDIVLIISYLGTTPAWPQ